jgi:head-tail adaptor
MALRTQQAQAGLLRERIRIDTRATVADGMGGGQVGWTLLTVTWALVTPMPLATEQTEGGGIAMVAMYEFMIRRRTDMVPTMRIVWPVDPISGDDIPASRQFNLRAINLPGNRELYMTLNAEMGVAI